MATQVVFPKEMVDEIVAKITPVRIFMLECECECLPDPKFFCSAKDEGEARQKLSERKEIIDHILNIHIGYGYGRTYTRIDSRKKQNSSSFKVVRISVFTSILKR